MKKIYITFIAVFLITHSSYAQWVFNPGTISTADNLLVGSVGSDAKFTVYQSANLGSAPKSSTLLSSLSGISGTSNVFQNNIWLVRNATGNDWFTTRLHDGISVDGSFKSPQVNTSTWWERDPKNDIQSWGTAANTYLTIRQGNVGLGTVTPAAKLDVSVDASSYTNVIKFGDAAPGYLTSGSTGIYFSNSSGNPVFMVQHGGNVGIGTTTPKELLSVNGNIRSKQVKVEMTNWPDFVFKSDYQLPSLPDVKAYIEQNQHLPEMPAEAEIIKNGVNLGEMVKLQTKKIEELTLYVIEKDEQLIRQQKKADEQEARIAALEKALSKLINR